MCARTPSPVELVHLLAPRWSQTDSRPLLGLHNSQYRAQRWIVVGVGSPAGTSGGAPAVMSHEQRTVGTHDWVAAAVRSALQFAAGLGAREIDAIADEKIAGKSVRIRCCRGRRTVWWWIAPDH